MTLKEFPIQAKILHPEVCQFTVGNFNFGSVEVTCSWQGPEVIKGQPFFTQLLELGFIAEIHLRGSVLTIKKKKDELRPWNNLAGQVGANIRHFLQSGQEPFTPTFLKDKQIEDTQQDSADVQKIKVLIADKVLPGLSSHGGKVEVVRYQDGVLKLQFSGGCQGCSQVNTTLKSGIETVLKKEIAGLKEIVDVTQHSAGANPYFKA